MQGDEAPRLECCVATSRKELKEAIQVLAESFAGTTTSAPEGSMDWVFGAAMRSPSGKLYEKLSEPPSKKRLAAFKRISKISVYQAWYSGSVILIKEKGSGKIKGVACVKPAVPHSWFDEIKGMAPVAGSILSFFWSLDSLARKKLFRLLAEVEKGKKTTIEKKHLYAMMIGIDPSAQGQGVGKALLAGVCDMADQLALPAYLEASGARNAGFYSKAGGFQVIEMIETIGLEGYSDEESYSHEGGMNLMVRPKMTN
jgi:GNAT superfamily N-acetyltransferase